MEPKVVRVWLLGGFRVFVGSRSTEASGRRLRKSRNLVKLLALKRGHRLHRGQVMDLFWPDLEADAAGCSKAHKRNVKSSGATPSTSWLSPKWQNPSCWGRIREGSCSGCAPNSGTCGQRSRGRWRAKKEESEASCGCG
jgi:hypothetical protein